jgi:hypothetical protein
MFRLLRMLKIVKDRSKLIKYINNLFKLGPGIERLTFFGIISMLLIHIVCCFWVMIASMEDNPDSWIHRKGYHDLNDFDLYMTSFYFTITTITTVGFGDITPETSFEKAFCIFIMLLGVIGFSFVTGSLSSIMSNLDSVDAKLKEKINVLEKIKRDYSIGPGLYEELRQALKFEVERDISSVMEFIDFLPHRLKVELSVKIHHNIILKIPFFQDRSKEFIAFVGPLLKPMKFKEDFYVYVEGDEVKRVYFLYNGIAGFVLKNYENTIFATIEKGDFLGLIDLIPSSNEIKENKITQAKRKFTV